MPKRRGRDFFQIFLYNVIRCKGTCGENFFLSLNQQIKVMGHSGRVLFTIPLHYGWKVL